MRDLDPIYLEERINKLEKDGGSEGIKHLTEVVESVDNSLIANVEGIDKHFYFDYQNGKLGFNTDEERGADTFIPFSVGAEELDILFTAKNTVMFESKDTPITNMVFNYGTNFEEFIEYNNGIFTIKKDCNLLIETLIRSYNSASGTGVNQLKYNDNIILRNDCSTRYVQENADIKVITIKAKENDTFYLYRSSDSGWVIDGLRIGIIKEGLDNFINENI